MTCRRSRVPALLALLIAVVFLSVSPRALFARDPNAPRTHSRRPRPARHVLPEGAFRVAQRANDSTRKVIPKRMPSGAELHGVPSLNARALVRLEPPDSQLLFEEPPRETSPPA